MSEPASYAVVVLAGGSARRMGGGDKTALDLGAGRSVLGHLVSSLDTSVLVVVVGQSRALERPVLWARESPPGGGPVAGLAAGLEALPTDAAEWVVVVAGDQPFAAAGVPLLLAAIAAGPEAIMGVDTAGRDQPLLAAYRVAALRPRLAGERAGRSMRSLLDGLVIRRVDLPDPVTLDVDDEQSLSAARATWRSQAASSGPAPPPPPR